MEITENVTNAMITRGSVPAVTAKEHETEENILYKKAFPYLTLLVLSKKTYVLALTVKLTIVLK